MEMHLIVKNTLKELLREQARIDEAVRALSVFVKNGRGGGRRVMDDDARERIATAMRQRWAKRKGKPFAIAKPGSAVRVAGHKTPIYPSTVLMMNKKRSVNEIAAKLQLPAHKVRALLATAKANIGQGPKTSNEPTSKE